LTEFAAGVSGEAERPNEPTRRVFFALWPDEALRTALADAAREAVRACGGRPVPAQNLHVTLAFLGSVPERRIPELTSLARRVANAFPADAVPLRLTFGRLEHWKKPQIVCATVSEEFPSTAAPIESLADALKREAVGAGFAPDLKPFHAHVTVARKVARPTRSLDMHSVPWSFTGFALVESHTAAAGALYSVIESWSLVRMQELSN
jgi:2'-5' RNA ligase